MGVNKRAKVLDEESIAEALDYIERNSAVPLRDELFVLFTVRMGLRAQEVASIHASDFMSARGVLDVRLLVAARGAKYGKSRTLPIHPHVREALQEYMKNYPGMRNGPIFFNQYGQPCTSSAVQKQLKRIYMAIGLIGCSSHSGRRTFGTKAARNVMKLGGSLKDVAHVMGHSRTSTTELYVELTPLQEQLMEMA